MDSLRQRNHCWVKKRIKTRAKANEMAHRMMIKYGVLFRSYKCEYCGKYHIGRAYKKRGDT